MSRRQIFTVKSPLGYRIGLSRDRWRQIVRFKHPALAGHEKDLRRCLESPFVIRESANDPSVHLYYSEAGPGFICVATAPTDSGADRFVVTAYYTKRMKTGREIWKS